MSLGARQAQKEKVAHRLKDLLSKRDAIIHAGFFSIYGYVGGVYATMTTPNEQVAAIKEEYDIIMSKIKAIDTEYQAIREGETL